MLSQLPTVLEVFRETLGTMGFTGEATAMVRAAA
jgi:hypothetical protein